MQGCLKVVGIFFVIMIALAMFGSCFGGGTARDTNVNSNSANVANVNSNSSNSSANNYNANANSGGNTNSVGNTNSNANANSASDASSSNSSESSSTSSQSANTNNSSSTERVESVQPFVANTNTMVFHYASCSYVKRMKDANKLEIEDTYSSVLAMGYTPCDKCNPHKSYY